MAKNSGRGSRRKPSNRGKEKSARDDRSQGFERGSRDFSSFDRGERKRGRGFDSRQQRDSRFNDGRDFRRSDNGSSSAYGQIDDNLVIGRNPVKEVLMGERPVDKLFVLRNAEGSIKQLVAKASEKGIPTIQMDREAMDRMAVGENHQGIIAVAAAYEYSEMEDVYAKAEAAGEPLFVVILDGIEDPHNLGAIIRTAECAGAHGIILPKRRAAGLTGIVAKTAAGALEHMPCVRVANLVQTMEELKEKGLWIAACDMGETPYYKQDLTGPVAVVIGNEGNGISRLVKEHCDFTVSMPIMGNINSLNASNAAAVIAYEVRRQRAIKED